MFVVSNSHILDRKPHNYEQSTLFFGNTAPDVQSTHTHTQTTNQKIMNQVMDVSTIIISRKRKEGQGKVNMFRICPTGDWLYQIPLIFGSSYQELYCGYDNSTLNHDQHTLKQYTTTSIFPSNVLSQCPVIPSSRMAYCSS